MRLVRVKNNVLKRCIRLFCTDKPVKTLEGSTKTAEDLQNDDKKPESPDIIVKSYDDCTKFEADAFKKVLIEKGQDAHLRSQLAKEAKIIPRSIDSRHGAIRLDPFSLQNDSSEWVSYSFEQIRLGNNKIPDSLEKLTVIPETTSAASVAAKDGEVVQFKRRVRGEPGKVLFAFIPEEWWREFFPKTGVSGMWTFLFTFATFLVSKEYYVLDHEFYTGISMLIIWTYGIKKFGPMVAAYLDKEVDAYEKAWNDGREQNKKALTDAMLGELHSQFQYDGQLMVIDVKRENVQMQLEEEYRQRLMYAYEQVKMRLDYHVATELVKKRLQHKNLIEYVTREVMKSVTPELQDKLIYYSIDRIMQDLESEKEK